MTIVAGVDGCRGGWLCIDRNLDTGHIADALYPTARELVRQAPSPLVMGIDIPIGLPEAGSRRCDRRARRLLGPPRAASVFPAPVRAALAARSQKEASALTRQADGRGVSAQAWGIYRKVKEIDDQLRQRPEKQRVVREVHPELSFRAWNGGEPIAASKKTPAGRAVRERLIAAYFGRQAFESVRVRYRKIIVADDDIGDAFAVLWTAERIAAGKALCVPQVSEIDSFSLPMEIWY